MLLCSEVALQPTDRDRSGLVHVFSREGHPPYFYSMSHARMHACEEKLSAKNVNALEAVGYLPQFLSTIC